MREYVLDKLCKHCNVVDRNRDEFESIMFYRPTGIRLSYKGYLNLKKIFDVYSFPINRKSLCARDLLKLHNNIDYPYYIASEYICLFSEHDAFMVKLCTDMRSWLDTL